MSQPDGGSGTESGAVELCHDVRIPVGSETLAATRYEPTASGPLPAVLMAIPYRKDDAITYGAYDPLLRYVARAGYEVVVVDLPGTGGSTGYKPRPLDAGEGEVVAGVIEWLADREWTDGTVGMVGKSYGGWTQLQAAARRPDALEAIVPIMPPFSPYHDSRYPGGGMSFKHAGGWLPRMHTYAALPPSYRDDEGRWADVWSDRLEALESNDPWLFDQHRNRTKNDYWTGHDVDVERIDVPVLAVGGWRDYFPATTVDHLDRVDAPVRLLMGPWRHTMPHRGREVAVECRDRIVEWFDEFLKNEPRGALDRPRITYWTERESGCVDTGVWRGREDWPTVETSTGSLKRSAGSVLEFAITADGLSTASAPDEDASVAATYEPDATVGVDSIHWMAPPTDTNGDDVRSLTFESDPVDEPLELTGTGCARLRVRSASPDPQLTVRLVDVAPDGSASLVTYGTQRASQRDDPSDPEPLEPDTEYAIDVPIRPCSYVVETGHRLRVAVSTGFFPRLLPPRQQGELTLLSDPERPSLVRLPGSDVESGLGDNGVEFAAPSEATVSPAPRFVRRSDSEWTTTRDNREDAVTVHSTGEQTLDLPHGPTMEWRETVEWSVRADDPSTAVVRTEIEATLEYDYDRIHALTTARTSDESSQITTTVTRAGQPTFEQTWRL